MQDDLKRAREALHAIPPDLPRDEWVRFEVGGASVSMLLSVVAVPNLARAQPADAEVRVQFPKFAPRASATTLFCSPNLTSSIRGVNESVDASDGTQSAYIGARIDKASAKNVLGNEGSIKLTFRAAQRLVQFHCTPMNTTAQQREGYGEAFPDAVLDDNPVNVIALWDRTKLVGNLQIISLDRETGTTMFTTTYASLPDRGHPYTSATFYVCSSTDWWRGPCGWATSRRKPLSPGVLPSLPAHSGGASVYRPLHGGSDAVTHGAQSTGTTTASNRLTALA